MSNFSFSDFKVFAGATNVNEDSYSTIAKGVISFVNRTYGIYPLADTVTQNVFLGDNQTSYTPRLQPTNSVVSITYDSNPITAFSYYGEDILLESAITEIRKPVTLELDVGFPLGEIPDDLILAVYRHIVAVFHAIDKHTDNLSKSVNSDGNTSYYNNDIVPPSCKQTYEFYAGHTLISF